MACPPYAWRIPLDATRRRISVRYERQYVVRIPSNSIAFTSAVGANLSCKLSWSIGLNELRGVLHQAWGSRFRTLQHCQHCIASPMVEELDWLLLLYELRSYGNSLSGRNTGRPPKPPKQSPHHVLIGAPSTATGDKLLFQMLTVSKRLRTFHHCKYAYLFVVSCVCISWNMFYALKTYSIVFSPWFLNVVRGTMVWGRLYFHVHT